MNARSNSSDPLANRSMPPGTIIPELVYRDLDAAVSWLCRAFGFRERLRIGKHRSQLVLGDASVVVVQSSTAAALQPGEALHSLMVRVEDVNRHYEHVQQLGARIVNPPTDYPYGERQYTVEDIDGRRWTFSQSLVDVDPRDWGGKLYG